MTIIIIIIYSISIMNLFLSQPMSFKFFPILSLLPPAGGGVIEWLHGT